MITAIIHMIDFHVGSGLFWSYALTAILDLAIADRVVRGGLKK